MLDARDLTDRPFGCPPDIVLDIPLPPSVNRTRKIDYAAAAEVEDWKRRTDLVLMAHGQYRAAKKAALDRFEITIILSEQDCPLDLDNPIKAAIDYLRRIELIKNDDKRYMRRIVVEWGEAPEGCRLVLRGVAA
mgnify:CR=1 FL=1